MGLKRQTFFVLGGKILAQEARFSSVCWDHQENTISLVMSYSEANKFPDSVFEEQSNELQFHTHSEELLFHVDKPFKRERLDQLGKSLRLWFRFSP